jgi:hypothetical protein
MIKTLNKTFAVSTAGMERGSVQFKFRTSLNKLGRPIVSINEIRYSVTMGKDKIWIPLPPFGKLTSTVNGFDSGLLTHFQHRVTTSENGTTEWGESGVVEILVNSEQLTTKD